jgi:hypothetical protein
MRKYLLLLFLACLCLNALPQTNDENPDQIRTLFGNNQSNGGYGALTFAYSKIGGHDAFVSGARGGFIFHHGLTIGVGGYGFINNINSWGSSDNLGLSLSGGYGGLLIEPIVGGKNPVHVSFPILIGGGGVALLDLNSWDYTMNHHYPEDEIDYDSYFVIEPAVELELNLARWFRMAAAVSYRYTSDIQLVNTDANALCGFNYGMTFKFGKF